jgi:hypothetical protein
MGTMKSQGTRWDEGYTAALLWGQINRMCGEVQLSLFMRPTGWKDEEKRVNPRVSCSVPVDYATQDHAYRGVIRNMCVGGAFIDSRELHLGPEITVVFFLHDDEASLKLRAEVAWIGKQGIGVNFRLGR